MSASPVTPEPRPIGLLGALLLGLGLGLRLLLPDEPATRPITNALARIPLFAGSGLILLEQLLRRKAAPAAAAWLLVLAILPGCFPITAQGVARALDFLAAVSVGIAVRNLVVHDGMGPTIRRWLLACGVTLSVIGLSQTLWQRDQLRSDPLVSEVWFTSPMAQAFLDSDRASATLFNANAFAGLLLLLLPLGIWRSGRRGAILVMVLMTFGFVAAGSAGATLALLLSLAVARREPGPVGPWCRGLALAGAAGVLLLITCLSFQWTPPLVGGKLATFSQRLDYHRLGFRMLDDMGLSGAGLEATRELRWAHARPDEDHSAHLHDTWLQLLIELGPVGLLALVVAVGLLLRGQRRRPESVAPPVDQLLSRTLGLGLAGGMFVAPLLNGVPRVLPLNWEAPPWLDGVILVVIAVTAARASRGMGSPSRAAWAVALTAFALHGLVDSDLYAPAAATVLATVIALAPVTVPRDGPGDRVLLLLGSALLLLMPLADAGVSLLRDEGRHAVAAVRRGRITQQDVTSLRALLASFPDRDAGRALLLAASRSPGTPPWRPPEQLGRRPFYRLLEAQRRAAGRVTGAPEIEKERSLDELVVPGEALEPWIRRALMTAAAADGDTEGRRRHAREGIRAMDRWNVTDPRLREALERGARP